MIFYYIFFFFFDCVISIVRQCRGRRRRRQRHRPEQHPSVRDKFRAGSHTCTRQTHKPMEPNRRPNIIFSAHNAYEMKTIFSQFTDELYLFLNRRKQQTNSRKRE